MSGYLLDTNIASHVIRGDRPEILSRLVALPMESIAISAVTEGERLFGVAQRGHPPVLSERVRQFLLRVVIRPWNSDVARVYGDVRAACENSGVSLAPH